MLLFFLTQLLTNTPLQRVVNYFVLCRKNKENQQQTVVFWQWRRDDAGSDVKRRLFGFTVMGCLLDIFYEIWNVVPKLLIELERDRHVIRSRSGSA